MGPFKLVAVLLLAVTAADSLHTKGRPSFIGCVDSSECSTQQCCMLGGGRYSSPQCVNLGEIGDSCRPVGTTPFNTTVEYPNGYSVTLTNIYFVMCACASGLECDLRSSSCQVP